MISYIPSLLKNAVLRSQTKLVYSIRPSSQVWLHCCFIHIFEIWAMYVMTGRRFTPSVVRYQISLHLIFKMVSLRSWSSVRKLIFALLPFPLAVSSLIHHNVISSWIEGIFTGLIASILNEFSVCSILGEVILGDSSQISISDAKMHLI